MGGGAAAGFASGGRSGRGCRKDFRSQAPAAAATTAAAPANQPPAPVPTPYGLGMLYAAPAASASTTPPADGRVGYIPGPSDPASQPKPPESVGLSTASRQARWPYGLAAYADRVWSSRTRPPCAQMLEEMLRAEGLQVVGLASGSEAVERLRAGGPVDLVLTDWRLPGRRRPGGARRGANRSTRRFPSSS